jgi:hypothetical protein
MFRRRAGQQNLLNGMLAETVQHATHIFTLPTGPSIKTAESAIKNAPAIIMPEMANAVTCIDTGKSLNTSGARNTF